MSETLYLIHSSKSPFGRLRRADVDVDKLKRILELNKLPEYDQDHILYTLDGLIKAAKLKAI